MGNENCFELAGGSSYREFELPGVDCSFICVGAALAVSPNWSQETMTCHSSNCFSIVNPPLATSLQLLHDPFISHKNSQITLGSPVL